MRKTMFLLTMMVNIPAFANHCNLTIHESEQRILSDPKINKILHEKGYRISAVDKNPNFQIERYQKYPVYWGETGVEKFGIVAEQFLTRSLQRYYAILDHKTVSNASVSTISFPEDGENKREQLEMKALRKVFKKMPVCQ